MTNKKQRTAYNLTKLVQHVNPDEYGCALYEIADDANLAMISLKRFALEGTYVFVPQSEWDKAVRASESRRKLGTLDADYPLKMMALKWLKEAMNHTF